MLFKFDGFVYTDEFNKDYPGYVKGTKKIYAPLHIYNYWKETGEISIQGETVIHHIDGRRDNNEFENLELLTLSEHGKKHIPSPPEITKEFTHKMSYSQRGKGLFGFSGCVYHTKNRNPWFKVWRLSITYNKIRTHLDNYNDPLTCDIIYKIIQNEIYSLEGV